MLADLSTGAAFLATGGGGDPYLTYLSARQTLRIYGPATMIKPWELDDNAAVVAIGNVGAPTTSLELLPSIEDSVRVLEAYRTLTGRRVDAVVSCEIGGGNSLVPIIAAAANGIPVIDGDGMGRALPETQMETFAIAGIKGTPAVVLDYEGKTAIINADTVLEYEREIRKLSMERGGMVIGVEFWMTGAQLKACVVPETVSLSIELGRILRAGKGNARQVTDALKAAFKPTSYGEFRHLFTGTVADMTTSVVGGFDVGQATIESLIEGETPLKIAIKNEYLVAKVGDRLLTSVPDLICILDYETAQPINAERLKYGQRVSVFGIGCPPHYRTEDALREVSPRVFGFDFDYQPIESL
jgi:DUF917 family protein